MADFTIGFTPQGFEQGMRLGRIFRGLTPEDYLSKEFVNDLEGLNQATDESDLANKAALVHGKMIRFGLPAAESRAIISDVTSKIAAKKFEQQRREEAAGSVERFFTGEPKDILPQTVIPQPEGEERQFAEPITVPGEVSKEGKLFSSLIRGGLKPETLLTELGRGEARELRRTVEEDRLENQHQRLEQFDRELARRERDLEQRGRLGEELNQIRRERSDTQAQILELRKQLGESSLDIRRQGLELQGERLRQERERNTETEVLPTRQEELNARRAIAALENDAAFQSADEKGKLAMMRRVAEQFGFEVIGQPKIGKAGGFLGLGGRAAVGEEEQKQLALKPIPRRKITRSTTGGAARRSAIESRQVPSGTPLDPNTAAQILEEAGGDKEKARQIARQLGYQF